MRQKISNVIGFLVVICFLLSLPSCSKSTQIPNISNTSPIKVGNFISGTLKLTFLGRPGDLRLARDVICSAREQIKLDDDAKLFELATTFNHPNATEEEKQFAEGVLELVSSGFDDKNIPVEGQTLEYGRFVWEVLGQICHKLGAY
jgi:hypothetical protein